MCTPTPTVIKVEYIHSVQRIPITEILIANSSGIFFTEMIWHDFGAGLPEEFDEFVNGSYVIRDKKYLGTEMEYWFIPENNATIILGSKVVDVNGLITLRVEKVSYLKHRLGRC
ncbi:hypothetical protein Py04_0067 [Pyrococcus sp. ST04]|nr:hypothetical protein Py04_0067 [Pyrococcus sp. ST04]